MSVQNSAIPSPPPAQETSSVAEQRSQGRGNFRPSVWGDYFLKYASDSNLMNSQDIAEEQIERLKKEVRKMLTDAIDKLLQKLNLIDQIQRLGLAYHFEIEIHEQLEQIHRSYSEFHHVDNDDDLHTTALLFRLLRQQGYNVSSEIFNKFKDNKGNFSESLITDMQGLLSLVDACHLGFRGDGILNDALAFIITHLESIDTGKVSHNLKKQVNHAMNQPFHKGLPRLEARHYIQLYQEEPLHNEILLSLAKLDFNLLQEQHQRELGNLTRWGNDLDMERNFPFARDRHVENYLWMYGIYFEPKYEDTRDILTKVMTILTIMDDLYDSYGTLEELTLFMEAIDRWDVDAKDGLPEYMQVFYQTILDFYDEIGCKVTRKGQSYCLFYAKEVMKKMVRAYFTEAKRFHQNDVLTMEEYMPVSSMTTGGELTMVTGLLGMGDIATKEVFEWLLYSEPEILKASNLISRLMNDIATHKAEQERGHTASSVECFMKQYRVTEAEAKEALRKQVNDAWKDMNEELCRLTVIPLPLLVQIINFARTFHVIYNDEKDHYTNAGTRYKELVTSLLVNPLPM